MQLAYNFRIIYVSDKLCIFATLVASKIISGGILFVFLPYFFILFYFLIFIVTTI